MKYHDLKLEIVPVDGGDSWQVRWDSVAEPFVIPFQVKEVLADLGARLNRFREAEAEYEASRQQLDDRVKELGAFFSLSPEARASRFSNPARASLP